MNLTNDSRQTDGANCSESRLEWTVVLLFRLKAKAFVVIATIVAAALFGYFAFGHSFMWSGLAVLVLMIAFGGVFTPHSYVFDDEGIEHSTWFGATRRRWSEFRRYEMFAFGVNLITRADESRFEHFRSMNIYLPEDSAAIIAFVERKMRENEQKLSEELHELKQ